LLSSILVLVLPSGQKLTLGLLAAITVKVVPFCAYARFPEFLPFFKCVLEVVFCEGVQHCLQFYLNHFICVKMVAFQFYLQLGKQKSRVGGDDILFFVKISLVKKGNVRGCIVMMQQLVLLSPKFGVKSSHIFTHSP
jgi:hypothetical protein